MSSTPMDLDRPERNGSSLNIARSTAPTSNLSDVMSTFRPTKVGSPPPGS